MDDRAVTLARRIAGFGLPGVPIPPVATLDDRTWRSLFGLVLDERITGLAIDSVADGWLDLADAQTEQLFAAHRDAMTWCLLIERKLAGLAGAFGREEIDFAVLKGTSVARTAYAEPCLRSFGDLDLLVRTADYRRACALLERLGHERQRPEPRPGFETRFGKGSVHVLPADHIEVDLHRTLVLGAFGLWIDPEGLLDRRESFDLGGASLSRLDATGMLLNVAMHASLGRSVARLVPLRDVAEIWRSDDVDWGLLSAWARRWHLTAVLQDAFRTASLVLGALIPPAARSLLEGHPGRGELRSLRAYQGDRRSLGGTSLTTIRAIPGVGSKAAYVRALVLPDRAFLRARAAAGARATYRRRWAVAVRWGTGRFQRHARSALSDRTEGSRS